MTLPTVHVLTWTTYRPGVNPTDRHASTRHIEVFPDVESLTHYRLNEKITWYSVDVCTVWPSIREDYERQMATVAATLAKSAIANARLREDASEDAADEALDAYMKGDPDA